MKGAGAVRGPGGATSGESPCRSSSELPTTVAPTNTLANEVIKSILTLSQLLGSSASASAPAGSSLCNVWERPLGAEVDVALVIVAE